MNKKDLENFTKEEVVDILVDLVNRMENDGNASFRRFDNNGKDDFESYAYGAALVTKVNYAKFKVALKNKESYDRIIGMSYTTYLMKRTTENKDPHTLKNVEYTKEEFINKIKTDSEFSERWKLKIEERGLTRDERYNLMPAITGHHPGNIAMRKQINNFEGNIPGISYHEEWLDSFRIPTKLIIVTYKDETIEIYE